MYIRGVGEGSSFASCLYSELSSLAFRSLRLRDRTMKKMLARMKPIPRPKPTTRPIIIPTFGLDLPTALAALLIALVAASVTVIF